MAVATSFVSHTEAAGLVPLAPTGSDHEDIVRLTPGQMAALRAHLCSAEDSEPRALSRR